MELYVCQWKWSAGTDAPASGYMGSDTGHLNSTIPTELRFHETAQLEKQQPVSAIMAGLLPGDGIRIDFTSTTTVADFSVQAAPVLADAVWTVSVLRTTGGGAVSTDGLCDAGFLMAVGLPETPPEPEPTDGWPTAAQVADAMGQPFATMTSEDQDWLARSTDSANSYAQTKSPAAWRLLDPAVPTPDLWQGTAMLAAHLFQRRATGTVAPDFGGDPYSASYMDPAITRLLQLDRHSPPRAV